MSLRVWLAGLGHMLGGLARLLSPLMRLHPIRHLTVTLSPTECLRVLSQVARPSVQRLEHRELFAEGRRYQLQLSGDGFRLTTRRKRRGRKLPSVAVVYGVFQRDDDLTRLRLGARMRLVVAPQALFVPAFISSIVVFMPWDRLLIGAAVLALFSLSWLAHRADAALEAHWMLLMVQKALGGYVPEPVPVLDDEGGHVIYDSQFRQAWEQIYGAPASDENRAIY